MKEQSGQISERSSRIAKNTLLLYFRMLLLMFIGLFTSRVILRGLGETDYGIYNAVGGIVTVFTFITSSISAAISRYLAYSLGEGDSEKLKKVFGTSVLIQLILSIVIVILVETAGVWFLNGGKMNIPAERLQTAGWVLQCSMGVLVINLLAIPYNAMIIAHEKMSAYAFISILEAILKLAVALAIAISGSDKLKLYSMLMLAVAFFVRMSYGIYCKKNFEECRGRIKPEAKLAGDMAGMAGWSFFGSSAIVFNTQGVNVAINVFFGVAFNAARGLATQVEGIVKQFVSNFLTALNPQITKSWASGDKEYCFELVMKGAKYSILIILAFIIPFMFEADLLLSAWLVDVPEHTATFLRLTLIGLLLDMSGNPMLTLSLARGNVKNYYLITGISAYLGLPLILLCFKLGLAAEWAYIIMIAIYAVVFVEKLIIVKRQTGFPVWQFIKKVMLKALEVSAVSFVVPTLVFTLMDDGFIRLILVTASALAGLGISSYLLLLTDGEKYFILRKVGKYIPDRLYLRLKFPLIMGYRLHLNKPRTLNEKIQWLKVNDRKDEYVTMADKIEVKTYIDSKLGEGYTIPTIEVWDKAEDIDFDKLPDRFVLKCNHDSGSVIICRNKSSFDKDSAIASLNKALKKDFSINDREWAYKGIRRRILAEPYISDGGDELTDYKFFCFNGEPKIVYVSTGLEKHSTARMNFLNMDWTESNFRRKDYKTFEVLPPKPECFDEMVEICKKLSRNMKLLRVDLYCIEERPVFSECTLYPTGGLIPFDSYETDLSFGKLLEIYE